MVVISATAAMRQTRRDPVAYLPSGARAIEWQAIGTRLDVTVTEDRFRGPCSSDAGWPHRLTNEARSGYTMLNTKLVTCALGIFGAITFVVCVIYGLVTPKSLHMSEFLEMVLPAFKWLTWWGFLLGLAESFLYGAYIGLVYCPIHNWIHRRWGT